MTNTTSAFSVDEVLKASWASVKKDWTKYLTLYAAVFLIYIVYFVVIGVLFRVLHIPQALDSIFSLLLGVYVTMVMTRGALMIVRAKKFDMGEIMKFESKMYLSTLLAMVLYYIACLVGFVLFIVPGIIAAIMFGFAFYSIVDKGAEGIQALEDSMRMTKGNKLNVFFFQFLLGLVTLAAIALPGVVILMGTLAISGGDFRNTQLGIGIVAGVLWGVILLGVSVVSGMVSTAAHAYMYNKMRAKTPLTIAK